MNYKMCGGRMGGKNTPTAVAACQVYHYGKFQIFPL